jgi:uncharacterized membrane protein SpoIIM required for sporulation
MKIQKFLRLKQGNWKRLEELLAKIQKQKLSSLFPSEIRELSRRYRRATSELAYAQTYFPGSETTRYLNDLVARTYQHIYPGGYLTWRGVGHFFLYEYPRLFRKNIIFFLISLALFLFSASLGFYVVQINPGSAVMLIPEPVLEKIEQKEMWTEDIFNVFPPALISSVIFTNNISVTFFAFALGILAGLGTIYILILNGLLLGMISSLCCLHDLAGKFWIFVLPHGLTELSLIFIAGAAGLILGNSWLSPGDYTRKESLRQGGREAVRLVLGGVPFLIVAGLVEGYISPSSFIPAYLKIGLGIVLVAALFVYLGKSRPRKRRLPGSPP